MKLHIIERNVAASELRRGPLARCYDWNR